MPKANILEVKQISSHPSYHGWPTVARRRNGELLVASSSGREDHICPYGQVHLIRSADRGRTWSQPQILADGPLDDRDAGVLETSNGTILANWFTSLAWDSQLQRAWSGQINWLSEETQRRWKPHYDALTDAIRLRELGHWMVRSTDGGKTWSEKYPTIVNSPHGPTELSDGRLFYAGKILAGPDRWDRGNPHPLEQIGVAVSRDDGQSWTHFSTVDTENKNDPKYYHEPYAIEAADGTMIVQIRTNLPGNEGETLQTESADGGQTWSDVHPIGVWGQPSHLLRLADDRLLMTYGYRREPFGNQARASEDNGRSWSDPITISDDGDRGDLGYPSSVQMDDGTLVSVWYEANARFPKAVLRMACWTLED